MDGSCRIRSRAHRREDLIDPALTTRPIAGIHWTADTAFIHHNDADHLALPLVIRFAQEMRGHVRQEASPQGKGSSHSIGTSCVTLGS